MSSFELKPTEENIIKTYKNDIIGRNEDVKSFGRMLISVEGIQTFAVDGKWGSGKTFFIKQVINYINSNCSETVASKQSESVVDAFKDANYSSVDKNILCVYYDAWENDCDEDPILSLVNAISVQAGTSFDWFDTKKAISIILQIFNLLKKNNFSQLYESLTEKSEINELQNKKNTKVKINSFFQDCFCEDNHKMIVFIDELDRCNPNYAMKLLERIKHYFDLENVLFVFSVNIEQLKHVVSKYYGDGFSSYRYLDRFFDFKIELPLIDTDKYLKGIIPRESIDKYKNMCMFLAKYFGFSMREICRYMTVCLNSAICSEFNISGQFYFDDGKAWLECVAYVAPILYGLLCYDIKDYDDFINGNRGDIFVDIMFEYRHNRKNSYLSDDELKVENSDEVFKTRLLEIYNAIFNSNQYNIKIHNFSFSCSMKTKLLTLINKHQFV